MATFRTSLFPNKSSQNITHQTSILCLGSCFAEHIGTKLQSAKFATIVNPFGIIYNPISISNSLEILLSEKSFEKDDLFLHNDLWHSFMHHGTFSDPDQIKCLNQINNQLKIGRQQLEESEYLLITLGTAHVFEHNASGQVVANCHKLPNSDFNRNRLSVEQVRKSLTTIFTKLHTRFPNLKIITSVSPVRHLRDGHLENQKSKATLLLALSNITAQFDFVQYFPAYELLLDDLRDYRFYKEDMIHPNETAINYIWDFFKETYFDDTTKKLISQIQKIYMASQHRPFHPNTPAHQSFLKEQLAKIQTIETAYELLDFETEKSIFKAQQI